MLFDYMEFTGFVNEIPLPGLTQPLLDHNEPSFFKRSLWYCPGNGLFVGWYPTYSAHDVRQGQPIITFDVLKELENIFIPSDPSFFKYKGAVTFNEIWFELPPSLFVNPRSLNFKNELEIDKQSLILGLNNGYEAFVPMEEYNNHLGVILFNPLKYIKQINHRTLSAFERYKGS